MQRTITVVRLCWAIVLLLAPVSYAAAADIVVVVDKGNPIYSQFIDGFDGKMQASGSGGEVEYLSPQKVQLEPARISAASLVVTVGTQAAREIRDLGITVPTIQTLVSKSDQSGSQEPGGKGKVSSLYIDQPPLRMLALVKAALPGRTAVTIGVGESSRQLDSEIRVACHKLGLDCEIVFMRDGAEIDDAMVHAAHSDHVLIIFPDPLVVNAANAKALILGAFMRGVALVGYSQALVKAGALMAVHSTPGQLGVDAANMVEQALASHPMRLPASRYPELFSVSVNYQLARALRLDMRTEGALMQIIKRSE